ncbi:MAG: hypothetical protein KJ623_01605 [Nanoarchaeota archaeon]|nr:hypothetical protein [Nanoarchaeota archaeon]MBU0962760.1 hypothetical protein [Nanoarchaeota archaeon]
MVTNLTSVFIENREIYAEQVWHRFIEILTAPYHIPEMLWIAIPLLITIFLMEIYFAKYREEELGWNTAYGNSIVLIFVAIDLIRHLFNNGLLDINVKALVIVLLIIDGAILTLIDFYHLLSKEFAFGLSSKLPTNFLAYCAIILVYTNIPVDWVTLGGLFLLLLTLAIIIKIIDLVEL